MIITIKIETDGAAFHDHAGNPWPGPEIARILRGIAADYNASADPHTSKLYDFNGNHVGHVEESTT